MNKFNKRWPKPLSRKLQNIIEIKECLSKWKETPYS